MNLEARIASASEDLRPNETRMVFLGVNHNPFNLQGVRIESDVLDYLVDRLHPERIVYVYENALRDGTTSIAEIQDRYMATFGPLALSAMQTLLYRNGSIPNEQKMSIEVSRLSTLDEKDLISENGQGIKQAREIIRGQCLHRLSQSGVPVTLLMESHPQRVIDVGQVHYRAHVRESERWKQAMTGGDVQESIRLYRRADDEMHKAMRVRDKSLSRTLSALLSDSDTKKDLLFVPFGAHHEPLVARVNGNLKQPHIAAKFPGPDVPITQLGINRAEGRKLADDKILTRIVFELLENRLTNILSFQRENHDRLFHYEDMYADLQRRALGIDSRTISDVIHRGHHGQTEFAAEIVYDMLDNETYLP